MPGAEMIRVDHLSKRFAPHGAEALHDVSFSVGDGEIVALLGPSGSGKSTALRIVAGLDRASAGDIYLAGVRVNDLPPRDRGVGFVFQHYALFRHRDVFENIAFGLRIRGEREPVVAARVAELGRLLGLEGLERRRPAELSGGQRQRVSIARALALRPQVLLLDEPFSAVDAQIRHDLRDWLQRLSSELHMTCLLVTHDQEEALELADRIVVLDHGRVEQVGSPQEIYDAPATPFVASFVGSMNAVEGRVAQGRARLGPLGWSAPGLPDGAIARLRFRPHDVRIVLPRRARDLPGVVSRVVFLGAAVRLEVAIAPGVVIKALLHRRDWEPRRLGVGQRVGIQIESSHAFPVEERLPPEQGPQLPG